MSGSVIIDAKVKMKRERDKTMKILGLSFGKKNANCDILTKEALYGAREAYPDAEIKFINTQRLNIGRLYRMRSMFDGSGKRKRQQLYHQRRFPDA